MKYFTDTIEFPSDKLDDILPWNYCWDYVSSSFLDGMINYVTIVKAYSLNRYKDWNDEEEVELSVIRNNVWVKLKGTKDEMYKAILDEKNSFFHTSIHSLDDDVLILGRIKEGKYAFFWYDLDCSDCCIGRFQTSDSEKQVIEEFSNYCQKMQDRQENGEMRELPLRFFKGWLKS